MMQMETKKQWCSYEDEAYMVVNRNRFVSNDLMPIPAQETEAIKEAIIYIEQNRGKISKEEAENLLYILWIGGYKWLI